MSFEVLEVNGRHKAPGPRHRREITVTEQAAADTSDLMIANPDMSQEGMESVLGLKFYDDDGGLEVPVGSLSITESYEYHDAVRRVLNSLDEQPNSEELA